MRVITQVQLLQITQLTESTSLNPGNVVGEEPQNLKSRRERAQERNVERVKETRMVTKGWSDRCKEKKKQGRMSRKRKEEVNEGGKL